MDEAQKDQAKLITDKPAETLEDIESQLSTLKAENKLLRVELAEAEHQNSELLYLLVASYRLHSTMDYVEIVKIVKEIMINLVGADVFGIFLVDKKKNRLAIMTNNGFDDETKSVCAQIAKQVVQSGEFWPDRKPKVLDDRRPVAGIPLKIDNDIFGAIVVHNFLSQKDQLQSMDFELFDLLGKHAAAALYSSKLLRIYEMEKKMNIRHEIDDLLPPSPSSPRKYIKMLDQANGKKK